MCAGNLKSFAAFERALISRLVLVFFIKRQSSWLVVILPLFTAASDHRWNAHTALHPLSPAASAGEFKRATKLFEHPNSRVAAVRVRVACRASLTVS